MKKQMLLIASVLFTAGVIFLAGCKKDDTTAPVITVSGSSSVSQLLPTTAGAGTWTNPTATAEDDEDGDISSSITVSGTVNPNLKGTYTLTYSVSDAAGNAATPVVITVTISNEADMLAGGYTVNEVCSVTPAFSYTPTITASNTVNKQFTISNWGGFYPSQCTSAPNVICNISGVAVNSTVSWSGTTMCGNATIDGSAAFGGGTLTNASTPIQMSINYRWTDGASTETCTGSYTKQ